MTDQLRDIFWHLLAAWAALGILTVALMQWLSRGVDGPLNCEEGAACRSR